MFPSILRTLSFICDTKKQTQWSWTSERRCFSPPSQRVSPHKTVWLRGRAAAPAPAAGARLAACSEGPNVSPVISAASSHAFAFLKRAGGLIGSESVIMNIVCSKQTLLLDCLQMAGSKTPIIRWGNFYTYSRIRARTTVCWLSNFFVLFSKTMLLAVSGLQPYQKRRFSVIRVIISKCEYQFGHRHPQKCHLV